jgi:CDP-4-dehydro-6-deoxyglucose reductase/terephthalate 1,2-dioxygenase reductase component
MDARVQIEGSEVDFAAGPADAGGGAGVSVLDAALRAGIELPYSCRKGVCGNCAARVVRGEVVPRPGMSLSHEACAPGQVLLCAAMAAGDLVIAPVRWRRADPAARKNVVARVYSHDRPAPDVSVLRLRLPTGQRVRFAAGQYLQVKLEDGSARCYSMANPPHENDGVTLHVRHVAGGRFTQKLATLRAGDTLALELPFGQVDLPAEDARPIVFVAGGTGFAPVKSILDDWARRKVARDITLVWGARDATGLYLPAAVDKWRKAWPGLRYVPALSDATDPGPGVFAGRADQALQALQGHAASLAGHVVYACGSPAMVGAVRQVALRAGADPADVHADAFVAGPA